MRHMSERVEQAQRIHVWIFAGLQTRTERGCHFNKSANSYTGIEETVMIRRLLLLPVPGLIFVVIIYLLWPEPLKEKKVPTGRLIIPHGDLIGQTYTNRCIFVSGARLKGVTNFAIRDCSLFDCGDVGIWVEKDMTNVSIEITGCLISGFNGWRVGSPSGTIEIR